VDAGKQSRQTEGGAPPTTPGHLDWLLGGRAWMNQASLVHNHKEWKKSQIGDLDVLDHLTHLGKID
jgi:hypothetical protein